MRTIKVLSVFAVLASLLAATPSFAILAGTEFIDFTGWDHTLIDNGPGQTFTDVFSSIPDVDVHVRATGDFSRESKYQAGWINDGLLNPGEANTYRFTFSKSVPDLVIKIGTADPQEATDVIGVGPETYFHDSGAFPNLIPIGTSGLAIIGNGVGQDPLTGAAKGEVLTSAQQNLPVIVRHRNLSASANKFEFYMVGRVPEPSGLTLIGCSLLGLLGFRKKS